MSLKIKKIPDRITILCMVLVALLIVIPDKFLPQTKYILLIPSSLEIIFYVIHVQYFNEIEKFDSDSMYICLFVLVPPALLFYILIAVKGMTGVEKIIGKFAFFAVMIVLLFLLYFWLIYLLRCKIVIDEIKKSWHVFLVKMIKPMLKAVLVCFSTAIIIYSLLGPCDNMKLVYQFFNVIINSFYPFIDMYIYVRSEIDEFDKQEQEKREELKKQKQKQKQEKKEKYKYDLYNYD